MQDLNTSQEQLRQLRALGVKIAIDDFGTGYSSLAYLRHFELDTLKIDRLFIANMLDSPRDAAVVSTIIDLGRNLGLEVIAEGVETQAQRDWLVQHQCAIMQGFLVAPGLSAEQARGFPAQLDWHNLPSYPSKPEE
jgi:EAL domain-containing protein (putative c-di-GMP-specific phosphodiesterase class I)